VGQFQTASSIHLAGEPLSTAVADLDKDGNLDVAEVLYLPSNAVTILLGNGDGTFRQGATYSFGRQLWSVTTADLRGNGILDLVVADSLTTDVYVLLGNGDGTFQPAVPYLCTADTFRVITGDFTGDGILDIVALTSTQILILPGNGDGTFQTGIVTDIPNNIDSIDLTSGDFDADGKLDLAVTGQFGAASKVDILLGNGNGTFETGESYGLFSDPDSVVTGDFNGDTVADLAIASGIGENIAVLLGKGDGTFDPPVNYFSVFPGPLIAADLNGDGVLDLVTANGGQTVPYIPGGFSVLKGRGNGTFQSGVFYPVSEFNATGPVAGDFNNDHQIDIVSGDFLGRSMVTLLNTGVVSFSPTTPIDFPFQLVGTASAPRRVLLTNTGTTTLTISSMTVKGPYQVQSTCGARVGAGRQCRINVTFTPKAQGTELGSISISDSASSKPQVIALAGTGTVLDIAPLSLTFPAQNRKRCRLRTRAATR
jgi:hypothetical protein